jgi:phosphoribosylanthranilate isomerase
MLKLFNENYYIDIDEIEKFVNLEITQLSGGTSEQQIKYVKYEMVKMMMEVLMTEREDADEMLGNKSAVSIPFKLAFNTLLNENILKQY